MELDVGPEHIKLEPGRSPCVKRMVGVTIMAATK